MLTANDAGFREQVGFVAGKNDAYILLGRGGDRDAQKEGE
jgi:hypothetical protein